MALEGFDVHGRVRRLENAFRAIRDSEFILPENKGLILRFLEFLIDILPLNMILSSWDAGQPHPFIN